MRCCYGSSIEVYCGISAIARDWLYVLLMHTRIAVVGLYMDLWQFWSFLPDLDVPDGRHVTIFLCISDGDSQIAGFGCYFVYHRRALHGVAGTISIERPSLAIERCLYLILIKESGVFELRPYLIELHGFAKVYL